MSIKEKIKWDKRFINLAKHIATWSKDPSTKVGAVIVDDKNRIVSVGYNGFPAGVNDDEERYSDREMKYELTQHSEINALLFAQRDLTNCTIYTYPLAPCTRCACAIIQSGIKTVVSVEPSKDIIERWGKSIELSEKIFEEAGVNIRYLELQNKYNEHLRKINWKVTEKKGYEDVCVHFQNIDRGIECRAVNCPCDLYEGEIR